MGIGDGHISIRLFIFGNIHVLSSSNYEPEEIYESSNFIHIIPFNSNINFVRITNRDIKIHCAITIISIDRLHFMISMVRRKKIIIRNI